MVIRHRDPDKTWTIRHPEQLAPQLAQAPRASLNAFTKSLKRNVAKASGRLVIMLLILPWHF
jgi:hypothetical protein